MMSSVIKSIYDHIILNKPYGKLLNPTLDEELIEHLSTHSPRAVKLAIEEAAFKAIRNQRTTIYSSDLPVLEKEKHRVGFI